MAEESKLAEKLEEKSSEVKFTEEEMNKVKEFQQTYVTVQQSLGQLSVTRIRLEQQLNSLDENEDRLTNKFVETQKDEKEFIDKITEKYGDGVLDPISGIFKSNKVE